ncbi:hypothetical protein D5018_00835 [Parashewanella curva]|uniref:Uncharacterized protein n=1 Tax=Parashewanella curva TaxID=2338552 RepID=A0A3L8Q265_9GAMM|nr:hypothetical protein [Parashewanella curva]RLV61695.1 hypothetical protein D5018_00835 [Parashewanella curva]
MPAISPESAAICSNRFLKSYDISPDQLDGIRNAQSGKEARKLRSVWQKICDWFYGDRRQVYDQLNLLLRYTDKNEVSLEQLHSGMLAFNDLRECCGYQFEKHFKVEITDSRNGCFKFKFYIEGLEDIFQTNEEDEDQDEDEDEVAPLDCPIPLFKRSSLDNPGERSAFQLANSGDTPANTLIQVNNILSKASREIKMLNQSLIRREERTSTCDYEWNQRVQEMIDETISQASTDLQLVDSSVEWCVALVKKRLGVK